MKFGLWKFNFSMKKKDRVELKTIHIRWWPSSRADDVSFFLVNNKSPMKNNNTQSHADFPRPIKPHLYPCHDIVNKTFFSHSSLKFIKASSVGFEFSWFCSFFLLFFYLSIALMTEKKTESRNNLISRYLMLPIHIVIKKKKQKKSLQHSSVGIGGASLKCNSEQK